MPPLERPSNGRKSVYAWTTGRKRSIAHVELIGKGGFGEVHKVYPGQGCELNHGRCKFRGVARYVYCGELVDV